MTIPKPDFPGSRPRRSSIAQAAAANRETTDSPTTETTVDTLPPAATPPQQPGETALAAPAAGGPQQAEPDDTRQAEPPRPRARTRNGGAARATTSIGTSSNKRLAQSRDILLSVPDDLKERMVNTIAWTTPHTGIHQQQKFIRKGIAELCDRLENQFNHGEPFPPPAAAED